MITINPDKQVSEYILSKIKENGGYCPCKLEKNEDNKCMCKEFREQKEGVCHCGLYIKNAV
ncbi:MAG TPA: hypothetical protein IAD01_05515 [Candidatus Faeciplasma gallinarum]|uniref:Uncharacterized protein n=1 Tax=Candidatus Faeciplasma gallinarum TaxID=2840799 RepID=A0A9D1EP47_9FIRM|nr:hypothetical protein [Candidatus Faeciplasma gallinarum]